MKEPRFLNPTPLAYAAFSSGPVRAIATRICGGARGTSTVLAARSFSVTVREWVTDIVISHPHTQVGAEQVGGAVHSGRGGG